MDHSPKPGEITSRFEKLLAALAADRVFLKQDSWRDKDKLDVQAMLEIIEREART